MDALHLRRHYSRVVVSCSLVVLACAALSCRMIDQPATGIDPSLTVEAQNDKVECFKQCREKFRSGVQQEQERYMAERAACAGDQECIQAAVERHRENLEQLREAQQECRDACYNEGSGGGGR